MHTVGRLRASVVKDLKLERFGFEPIAPDVRLHAPMPDGSSVTFWGDAARTAEELRTRSAHDADAYPGFDAKIRAIASFLAYVQVAIPPDPASPSLADAIMGLKLGKAFRDLGARTGREAIRALPMAVADLVQEVFEEEAVRGPLATRGVLYTAMGAWATGTAQVFLNDSAGTDGGAAGTAVFARGGTDALADALEASAAGLGVQIRTGTEVVAIRTRGDRAVGVGARRRHRARRAARRVGRRSEAHAAAARSGGRRTDDGVARREHPPARRDGPDQLRARGPAGVRGRRRGAARAAGS